MVSFERFVLLGVLGQVSEGRLLSIVFTLLIGAVPKLASHICFLAVMLCVIHFVVYRRMCIDRDHTNNSTGFQAPDLDCT